jgi:chromosome segregation ATPase
VGKRDTEIKRLKAQIDSMQETLTKREEAIDKSMPLSKNKSTARTTATELPDPTETRELRDRLRRLKDNLKVEHDERNRALRDLHAARDQLRRSAREKQEHQENQEPEKSVEHHHDDDDSASTGVEWERQALRIPEYGVAFRDSLRHQPRQAAAAALALAGRLAGGDPSAWKTVRALKLRPGTLRARVAGDYRMLFEIGPGDTLRLVDFILRRDLDNWLKTGH